MTGMAERLAKVAEVLAAHERTRSSAGWNGSPDPGNWRNIATVCICNERIADPTGYTAQGARGVAKAHREHQGVALAPLLAQWQTEDRWQALREAADALYGDERAESPHGHPLSVTSWLPVTAQPDAES